MRQINIFSILFCLAINVSAQQLNIIPQPVSVKQPKIAASFSITPATQIVLEGSNMENAAGFFNDYLQKYYLLKLKVVKKSTSKNIIRLNYERLDNEIPGAYNMTVDAKGIYIAGDNEQGVFYGIQTLIQLLPIQNQKTKIQIPFISITDYPRFAWRGLHLDVSRHFFPVEYIKKYIDYIALHKMNYFHWHLTDDQGWRIEIKKYPKLTSFGGWRDGTIIGRYPGTGNDNIRYGGFYTQENIREVVDYAAKRYITVIPEIEMPGHSMAALAAYPQLSTEPDSVYKVSQTWGINGKYNNVLNPSEYTFNFLQDVLDEVMNLFPSPYIHIGGDECDKQWWHKSPFCQQLMKEKYIKNEEGLQSFFIQRMENYINSKGKKIIGWDEILEGGLAPNATVMSWRGEEGGIDAAKQNHDVIMTPGNPVYFDHTQSQNEDSVTIGGYNPIEKVYAYEPIPKELNAEQAKHVLGAQANMWTEYMGNTRKVEYMLFPRLSALSEVLWSKKENRDWKDFEKRLIEQFKRYDLWEVNYSKAYFDLKATVLPSENNMGILWKLESKYPDAKIYYNKELDITDAPNPPAFYSYDSPIQILKSGTYYGWPVLNGNRMNNNTITQKFSFNKATGKKVTLTTPASDKYPGDGPFTLVNGAINEKGFARSREFLGFNGTDCEAIIDLGKEETINEIKIHVLDQQSSWIYPPDLMNVYYSADGINFIEAPNAEGRKVIPGELIRDISRSFYPAFNTRYIKVLVKNFGIIPNGKPGASNKAWLFVDEIEVN
jgi:hexosaminidase